MDMRRLAVADTFPVCDTLYGQKHVALVGKGSGRNLGDGVHGRIEGFTADGCGASEKIWYLGWQNFPTGFLVLYYWLRMILPIVR